MQKKTTQRSAVRDYLLKNGKITSIEAIKLFGATRLSAIIFDLRKAGYDIESIDRVGKNRYGQTTVYAEYIFKGYKPEEE